MSKNNFQIRTRVNWIMTHVAANRVARFKRPNQHHETMCEDITVNSASCPIQDGDYLEIQPKYFREIKSEDDVGIKISIPGRHEKMATEIANLFAWGFANGFIERTTIEEAITTWPKDNFFVDHEQITYQNCGEQLLPGINRMAQKIQIQTPKFLLPLSDGVYLSLRFDHRQHGTGIQGLLALNFDANQIKILRGNQWIPVVGRCVNSKDQLAYEMDQERWGQIIWPTIQILATLSKQHQDDLRSILETIVSLNRKDIFSLLPPNLSSSTN